MRKLIRCRTTNAFLSKDGRWTHDLRNAADVTGPDLHLIIRAHPRKRIEVYYHFGEDRPSQYDFTVAVP